MIFKSPLTATNLFLKRQGSNPLATVPFLLVTYDEYCLTLL